MTVDPAIVIAFIGSILALLGFILRLAINGDLTNPAKVVPRADYEALRAINAGYPEAFKIVAESVTKLAASVDRIAANGKERT